jgi:EAL domain-containing protein (putative c-di-GMP-specific phosphodiesterase class I)
VVGLEALLRWDHPRHGTIGPGHFIPTAEHTDLLPTLTRYVLDLAMQDALLRRSQGIVLPVSVNISARDLLDHRLSRDVGDLLSRYRYPAGDLTIEVTESALMADEARATQVLHELVDVGLNLSIDDFGTGYASLARLRDQPFTELKLDRSFVTTMISGAAGTAIVQAVIALARTLHLRVVAEGIEQQGQLEALTSHGCEDGQGFLLSRPLTVAALAQLLRVEPQIPLVTLPSPSRETVAVEVAS